MALNAPSLGPYYTAFLKLRSAKTVLKQTKRLDGHPYLDSLGEFFSYKNAGKNLTSLVARTRPLAPARSGHCGLRWRWVSTIGTA